MPPHYIYFSAERLRCRCAFAFRLPPRRHDDGCDIITRRLRHYDADMLDAADIVTLLYAAEVIR